MGINTDLNVDPYYDDFDESKQFNKVLFKPAKAVQARELTQLQTILQKQVERFGSNVYKEGTIISGINLTARDDLFYVRLNDEVGFDDPTIYNQTTATDGTVTTFTVTGQNSGLIAEIISSATGFQTQNPNLKTFFIKYLNTTQSNLSDTKEFLTGEVLDIKNSSGATVANVTVNSDSNHAGKSFGVSCEEGVIYQKGHFIFVDNQFVIVEKYSNVPGNVSVGFSVKENLIDSDSDTTLLDNASGFNNQNAPGADRLQLVPTLVSYPSASEPTEFFALIRYVDGLPVRIRDKTEFNTIGNELARRTYEESGNYVINGLDVSLESEGGTASAVVSPGKAYVNGKEVTNVSPAKLAIEPVTLTQTKTGQHTGVSYGKYFTYAHTAGVVIPTFLLDGTRYNLLDSSNAVIGSCSIANIEPGKIYVYAIQKVAGKENEAPAKFHVSTLSLTNSGKLTAPNSGGMIFDTGKASINSISDISAVRRIRESIASASTTITLAGTSTERPLAEASKIVAIKSNGTIVSVTSAVYNGNNVDIVLSASCDFIYYDKVLPTSQDTLTENVGFVKTRYNATVDGSLGVPNVIEIIQVLDTDGGTGFTDVTSKFRLVNNQQDAFYGISYIKLYAGETLANTNLLVKFRYLSRTGTSGPGFLTKNSYDNVSNKFRVQNYTSKDLIEYNLFNSFDFRPYRNNVGQVPSGSAVGAEILSTGINSSPAFTRAVTPANNSTIVAQQQYYLARKDRVVLDEYSNIQIIKGGESENPSLPNAEGFYTISDVSIPGNTSAIVGEDKITVKSVTTSNYTMADIGKIDQRLDSLINLVSLSLLERETSSMLIEDGNGANRFKCGILADSAKDLTIADIEDPEFRSSIDTGRSIIAPAVKQFPIDMVATGGVGITQHKDVVTLATNTNPRVSVISQPYATTFRNCVSNFYSYDGKAIIHPPFNSGYDVVKNPAVNVEIDIAGPMLDLVENIQEIMPLTSETLISEERTGTTRPRRRVIMGQFEQTIEQRNLTSSTDTLNQAIGNFVTDVNMKPFLRRQAVKVLVTGLRPNTRHYFFFDQKSVDSHVAPGTRIGTATSATLDVTSVSAPWQQTKGNAVRTDANGILSAVFTIPAETFFVGENVLEIVDVDQYSSIDSASTSYGRATYRGYNFALNKTDLSVTTRTPDFDTALSIITREVERQVGDPIAQTFKVKSSSTGGSNVIFVSDLDVFFKQKSSTVGVTCQIREVINGYPSKKVLPFASKHLESGQVQTSETGITATKFTFDNPIKLQANKEYSFVIIPDANSPDYLIYTSKVGATSLSKGTTASSVPVTSDWGDGVLFTSTNDSAWKSYQDEDIKFELNRYEFGNTGSVNLVPNDVEFLTIRDNLGAFLDDELAYVRKTTFYSASVLSTLNQVQITGSTAFTEGEYLYLKSTTNAQNDVVAKITDLTYNATSGITSITLDTPFFEETSNVSAYVCVAGRVAYYNDRDITRLHLQGSTAKSTNYIDDEAPILITALVNGDAYTITTVGTGSPNWTDIGATSGTLGETFVYNGVAGSGTNSAARPNTQVIKGLDSGATAKVTSVNNEKVSYFQPMIYSNNSLKTTSSLELFDGTVLDKAIPDNSNIYMPNNVRVISSKSQVVNPNLAVSVDQKFIIKASLSNVSGGVNYGASSPIIDNELSMLNCYQYKITDVPTTTSNWITKEVILNEEIVADDLEVFLSAYRPAGTIVDVYARFVYPENVDTPSDWYLLSNLDTDLYSNISNTKDYREFHYKLLKEDSSGNGLADISGWKYESFQLKIVLRHATTGVSGELGSPELNTIVPDINIFPHVYDYRAIALT